MNKKPFEDLEIIITKSELCAYEKVIETLKDFLYDENGDLRSENEHVLSAKAAFEKQYGFFPSFGNLKQSTNAVRSVLTEEKANKASVKGNAWQKEKMWEFVYTPETLFLFIGIGSDFMDICKLVKLVSIWLSVDGADRDDYTHLCEKLTRAQAYYDAYIFEIPYDKKLVVNGLIKEKTEYKELRSLLKAKELETYLYKTPLDTYCIKYEPKDDKNIRLFEELKSLFGNELSAYNCPTHVFKLYRKINNMLFNPINIKFREKRE